MAKNSYPSSAKKLQNLVNMYGTKIYLRVKSLNLLINSGTVASFVYTIETIFCWTKLFGILHISFKTYLFRVYPQRLIKMQRMKYPYQGSSIEKVYYRVYEVDKPKRVYDSVHGANKLFSRVFYITHGFSLGSLKHIIEC